MAERPERELASDLAEVAIDAVLDDGLLKDIPIVGSLINLAKFAKSIPDRIFAAKVARFVSALSRISKPNTQAFLVEIAGDSAKRSKLSEVLTLTIDRMDDLEKSEYIACVFMAYVEQMIDLTVLRRLDFRCVWKRPF
ncbi:MAG TPA: hypothetical protein VJU77_06515 [Chthoniobacterales bacterium]|nr:hypothetical protein [Chthoniobacterales bacterium]